jgi:hypothetical protein
LFSKYACKYIYILFTFLIVGELKRLNMSEGEYESLEAMESAKATEHPTIYHQ